MKRLILKIFGFICISLLVTSCFPTRSVPKGDYLFQGNSYKIIGEKLRTHNISAYYLQKTNTKVLVFKPYLQSYDFGTRFKDSSVLNKFFTKTLGEPPVLFDSSLVISTANNIKGHLNNLGYYNAKVVPQVLTFKYLKIASIKYLVYPNKPYRINSVNFDIEGKSLRSFVLADWGKSLLDTGLIFSLDALKKERTRISDNLRNLGYYYFTSQQITFLADTIQNKVNLTLKIDKQTIKTEDSIQILDNKRYKFHRIYIHTEVSNIDPNIPMDTTIISYNFDKKVGGSDYYFIHQGKMQVNPKAIIQAIYIKANRIYKNEDVAQSYKSLYNLKIYKYINVTIKDLHKEEDSFGQLDVVVQLSKMSRFSISSDSELRNTAGQFGVEQGFGVVSRNTFRNGEILKVDFRAALEVQNIQNATYNQNNILKLFNTFEAGINPSLEIPRFFAPIRRNLFSRYFNPKTKFELGYNYQNRPDYRRTVLTGTYGYNWSSSRKVTHILNPFELSSVKIFTEPYFQDNIDKYQDPRIKYSYQDHLVLGTSYSYLYNGTKVNAKTPYQFFFAKTELGGTPYNLVSKAMGSKKDSSGQYYIAGLPYSQFIRLEADYRYYLPTNNGLLMHVFRLNFGIGIPLFGSVALPFEKSFYVGGANSLRAWAIGSLGPGSFNSGSKVFEMTGDMRMEANYEFRFPISGSIKGAFFTDAGNIFLLKESDVLKGGKFNFYDFYQKIAIDIGYGIRYDLNFIVIRFDIAHPIYQPYNIPGDRWSMTTSGVNPKLIWAFNFAIGYPF